MIYPSVNTHFTRPKVWNLIHFHFICTVSVTIKTVSACFTETQSWTPKQSSKRGEDKFIVKRKKSWAEPVDDFWNMIGGNVTFKPRTIFNVLAGVEMLQNVCVHVLPHTATILHNMFHTQFGFFKGSSAEVLKTFCALWFLFAWCHSMFSPQWVESQHPGVSQLSSDPGSIRCWLCPDG